MANTPDLTATAQSNNPPLDLALFHLEVPIRLDVDGVQTEIDAVSMRALKVADLPLLDRYKGQPIALAQHLIAALCDLDHATVLQIDLDDFTMLSSDALYQVEMLCADMGLPAQTFIQANDGKGTCDHA